MPYKNKADQHAAMRRIQAENRALAKQAKQLLGIPLDRRRKNLNGAIE
jgi:hypothetical protein